MLGQDRTGLFVGIRIRGNLKRLLEESSSRYDYLFGGEDEQSLHRVTIDGDEMLGRFVEQGTTVDSFSNVVKNLRSILSKICPGYAVRDSEIKIYARTAES